jgi:flagellar motility protein MotE (MotC chaperone)
MIQKGKYRCGSGSGNSKNPKEPPQTPMMEIENPAITPWKAQVMAQYATAQNPAADKAEEEGLSTLHKVAILMVAPGEESSGQVMKFLSDFEIEEITQAIAALKNVTPAVMDQVLEEFEQHLLAGAWMAQGGVDFAREILERAVGPRKAQEILDRVNTRTTSGFYILKNVAPQQIAPLISNEHPQTIALILSQLDPDQAAGILGHLPERLQAEVAYRIATMENIHAERAEADRTEPRGEPARHSRRQPGCGWAKGRGGYSQSHWILCGEERAGEDGWCRS